MKARQIFWLVVFLIAGMATWLLVWKNHYTPCIATSAVGIISAWRTGRIDMTPPNGDQRDR